MSEQSRNTLKSYFQTGDRPTQAQFAELIDSFLNKKEDEVIVDSNKNIGIGFPLGTSLTAKLEVDGDIKATNLQATNGITAPNLQLTSGGANGDVLTSDGSGNGNWMPIPSAPPTLWTEGGSNIYRLGGNVGIGLNNPSTNLEVNGKIKSSSLQITSGAVNGRVLRSDGSGNASWQTLSIPPQLWSQSGSNIYRNTGNVGIGISNPSRKLHIVDDSTSDVVYAEVTHAIETNTKAVYGRSVPADFHGYGGYFEGGFMGVRGNAFGTGSVRYYGVYGRSESSNTGMNYGTSGYAANGAVNRGVYGSALGGGINYGVYGSALGGSTNYAVYANGDFYSTTSWQASDKRFKKNIKSINQALGIIEQLNPVTYDFNQEGKFAKLNFATEKQYGFIAQELEAVVPDLVRDVPTHLDDHLDEEEGVDKKVESQVELYKGMNYIEIIPIAIKGIQEQQELIEELQARVKALEAQ